jgi:hypothetical protein
MPESVKEKFLHTFRKLNPVIIYRAKNRVKSPEGKRIVGMVGSAQAVEASTLRDFSSQAADLGLFKMSEAEARKASELLRSKDPSMGGYRALTDQIHALIKFYKPDVGYVGTAKEGYVPRMLTDTFREKFEGDLRSLKKEIDKYDASESKGERIPEMDLKKALLRAEMNVRKTVEFVAQGQFRVITIKRAIEEIYKDIYRQSDWEPSFLKKRKIQYPEGAYETDLRVILTKYFRGVARWRAGQEVFGKDYARLNAELLLSGGRTSGSGRVTLAMRNLDRCG